jgi:16S rRNA (guanine1207-N2)-methyltransferase
MRHAPTSTRLSGEALVARELLEARFPGEDCLVVGPQEAGLPARFGAVGGRNRFVYTDFALYRGDREVIGARSNKPVRLELGLDALVHARAAGVAIVFVAKAKRLLEHMLALTACALPPGTPVIVAGAKRAGIKSSRSVVERLVGEVIVSESAHHASAFVAQTARDAATERDAVLTRTERRYHATAWGACIEVVTLPGVFSEGRLDDGTAFLLQSIPPPLGVRTVLDWGCGAGVIGTFMRRVAPAAVDFVDVSTMAVDATRRTLYANGLAADRVWLSDRMSDIDARYDLIVANPPFHAGRSIDCGVTRDFLAQAASRLNAGGRITVVANRFLNYLDVMQEYYDDAAVSATNRQFHVLQARRRRR